jgi:hypothetical protein
MEKGKPSEEDIAGFFRDLQETANRDLFPKLRNSRFTIGLIDGQLDVKLCLEVGASLLMDKPLILIVKRNTFLIPAKLRSMADAVIEFDSFQDVEVRRQIEEAIQRVLRPAGVQ